MLCNKKSARFAVRKCLNVFKEVVFAVKQFVVLGFRLVAIVLPFCLRRVVDLAQNVLFLDAST